MRQLESGYRGQVGRTVSASTPWWAPPATDGAGRPNVIVVVLDDTGWSDFGCFGSEVATPTIDRLAAGGLRYTNFHVTPLCSPTRACLLTGRNHHAVGMRFLADTDTGFPNSRGRIRPDVPMLPQHLHREGYGTYLVGKWHLTPSHEITPAGPYDNWPLSRGFEKFYGFVDGCTDQYLPELYQDQQAIESPTREGYHLSTDLVDRAIRFATDHVVFRPSQPFFLQLAFGATHAPFQAPRAYIDKYVDVFAKGWDRTRLDRLHRQRELGIVPGDTDLAPLNDGVPEWNVLSDDERRLYTHLQAAFAGFLEHADAQLGRLVTTLEELGLLDDTFIAVMSDNGASREGGRSGAVNANAPYGKVAQTIAQEIAQLDRLGGPEGPAHYPEGWAMAGNTPFRLYKQFVDLGGVRSPLVVHWPRGIHDQGQVRQQFVHAIDLAPTLLDIAGCPVDHGTFDGRSITATFTDPSAPPPRDTQYFEMLGHRAIWHRGWKAVTTHIPGTPYEHDTWRLYDTSKDFAECEDLAEYRPDRLQELQKLWWREAEANFVLPLDDRPLTELLGLRTPQGLMARRTLVLYPHSGHVPLASAVTGTDRSMRVTARLRGRKPEDQGVIIASGSRQGGYALYLRAGRLVFEHHMLSQTVVCSGDAGLVAGDCHIGFTLDRHEDRSGRVSLFCDDTVVDSCKIPVTSAHLAFWGLDIGHDPGSQVSTEYDGSFPFPSDVLQDVTIVFLEDVPVDEMAEAIIGAQ
ncbi:MAG: arylsulfatase [Actinomycetes bacterium]